MPRRLRAEDSAVVNSEDVVLVVRQEAWWNPETGDWGGEGSGGRGNPWYAPLVVYGFW